MTNPHASGRTPSRHHTDDPSPISQCWPAVLAVTSIFFLNFGGRVILAPLLPLVEHDLGLDHAQAASFFLIINVCYSLMMLAAAFLAARLGHRAIIVMAAVGAGAGLLAAAHLPGAWGLGLGVGLMGLAGGLYLPSGIATITGMVRQQDWGKGLAIHELAPNSAMLFSPVAADLLLRVMDWRGILSVTGVASLALGLAWARWGRGGRFKGHAPHLANLAGLFRNRSMWPLMGLFTLGVGASLAVYALLPLYLVDAHGYTVEGANRVLAGSRVLAVGTALAAGWVADYWGARFTMGLTFALVAINTALVGLLSGPLLVVAVFVHPCLVTGFFPAGFSALSSLGPPQARNLAVSLVTPVAITLGGGVLPAWIGWMGQHFSFQMGYLVTATIFASGVGLAWALPRQKD